MNRHLNLYSFFNNHDKEYIEDNLSRAFAICLKYDNQLLDNVLKFLLPEQIYQDLFNTDEPNYNLKIDIQKEINQLDSFTNIIAVACSGNNTNNFVSIKPRKTEKPITDVCIEVNDTCIIFEFKRTEENPVAQLKGQAVKIKELSDTDKEIIYKDFSWKKIIRLLLNVSSIQKQINQENPFTKDLIEFLEKKHPYWFPHRLLRNIIYTKNENDPNFYYLNRRLNEIKDQVFGPENTKNIGTKYSRYVINQNFGWANEIHVEFTEKENAISVSIHPGDTKLQGSFFFKPNKKIIWPKKINGYDTYVEPYLKFSHFNSGILWLKPNNKEVRCTHSYKFFKQFAGRWGKNNWKDFKKNLNEIIPNWTKRCPWHEEFENLNRNRTYFVLSIGTYFSVYIPYDKAKQLDNDNMNSNLAKEIREVILRIKEIIDN